MTIPGSNILVIMAANFELGHNECRSWVCVYCSRKADRPFSEKDIACIQLHLTEGYNVDNPDFPNGICFGCHLELSRKDKSDEYSLKILVNGYDPKRVKGCQVARHNIPAHDEEKAPKMQLLFLSHIKYAVTALRTFIEAVITQQPPVKIHVGAKCITLNVSYKVQQLCRESLPV